MQAKLDFLLDRSGPFTTEKVQILDQLTNSMKTNAPDVHIYFISRLKMLIRYGGI